MRTVLIVLAPSFSLYYKSPWEGVMVHYVINLVFVFPGCAPTICNHPRAKYTDRVPPYCL